MSLDDESRTDLRRAREAVTALHLEGDPMGFVVPYREALAEDAASGGDMRRIGFVSALTLVGASALREIDRLQGAGAGVEWLREFCLRQEDE